MMQIYQNHVVFQSFSDLFYIEQQQQQQLQSVAGPSGKVTITLRHAGPSASPKQTDSAASSPASSRPPSLLFSDESMNKSATSLSTEASEADDQDQYYPAGLYHSSVERRRLAKEADVATLYDVQLFQAGSQDLSLRRFA